MSKRLGGGRGVSNWHGWPVDLGQGWGREQLAETIPPPHRQPLNLLSATLTLGQGFGGFLNEIQRETQPKTAMRSFGGVS